MKIALIGRTEILFNCAHLLISAGHELVAILTAKEAPEYTKTSSDFQQLAKTLNIPFKNTHRIEDASNMLAMVRADIGLSINYSGIIPQTIIDLFPLGILNAHGGDLPRYRGNACQAWAILNGEPRIGLCIHRMIGGELDSGDIVEREYLDININTKVTAAWNWMAERVPIMLLSAAEKLYANPQNILEVQSKCPSAALRCYPRLALDGQIDWKQSAEQILRLINASNKPYSGAFCNYEDKKIIIWDAEIAQVVENYIAVPGQVLCIDDNYINIATGNGALKLNEIESDGEIFLPKQIVRSIRKRFS
jgi:methionyl-tRNA formyltransferase